MSSLSIRETPVHPDLTEKEINLGEFLENVIHGFLANQYSPDNQFCPRFGNHMGEQCHERLSFIVTTDFPQDKPCLWRYYSLKQADGYEKPIFSLCIEGSIAQITHSGSPTVSVVEFNQRYRIMQRVNGQNLSFTENCRDDAAGCLVHCFKM